MCMDTVADHLARCNDPAVTLARAATGPLFQERTAINGREVAFYLDTGAGRTVVDLAAAQMLGRALREDERGAGGAGTAAMKSGRTQFAVFEVGPLREDDFPAQAVALSHVNQALRLRGERPMDGVLGADLLEACAAVIDYRQRRLYLKRAVRPRTAA